MDVWMDSGVAWHCARKMYDDADAAVMLGMIVRKYDRYDK